MRKDGYKSVELRRKRESPGCSERMIQDMSQPDSSLFPVEPSAVGCEACGTQVSVSTQADVDQFLCQHPGHRRRYYLTKLGPTYLADD